MAESANNPQIVIGRTSKGARDLNKIPANMLSRLQLPSMPISKPRNRVLIGRDPEQVYYNAKGKPVYGYDLIKEFKMVDDKEKKETRGIYLMRAVNYTFKDGMWIRVLTKGQRRRSYRKKAAAARKQSLAL